jgi:hypothetical protein
VAQLTQAVLLGVVVHNDVKAGEPAVVEKMEEACFYSQVSHDQQRKRSDVSNGLILTSEVLLAHSFSADYSMEGLTVFVGGRNMQELQEEGAMNLGIVVDSMQGGKECARRVMQYSVRKKDVAVAVLDP